MQERSERSEGETKTLPMVPLRDIVVFPHTMVPFVVGRKSSLLAVERALDACLRWASPRASSSCWSRL